MKKILMFSIFIFACSCTKAAVEQSDSVVGAKQDESRSTDERASAGDREDTRVVLPDKVTERGMRIQDEQNTIDIFDAAAPATVFVTPNRVPQDWESVRTKEINLGGGTGFVWNKDGYIVTNYHVIDGARNLHVMLYNQKIYPAKFIGGEIRKDIAVLKIEAPGEELRPIALPDKNEVIEVGQKAVAIGNPFGLDHTLTSGVISAIGRNRTGYGGVTIKDMVQTDASINPGNSGGPLLDSQGRLIGMNTMIVSQSGSSSGIGFAVPVSTIRHVVPQIIRQGHVEQVGLGISILSRSFSRRYGIDGVIIQGVAPGSPAEKAGLSGLEHTPRGTFIRDVITHIDGKKVRDYDDLYTSFDGLSSGTKVRVTVQNNGIRREVEVELYILPD